MARRARVEVFAAGEQGQAGEQGGRTRTGIVIGRPLGEKSFDRPF